MESSVRDLVKAHTVLSELPYSVTYVGGATIPLFIDDPAAPAPRATDDVKEYIAGWATELICKVRVHDYVSAHAPRSGRAEILIKRLEEISA